MKCTINDLNLSFDKDNKLRTTIGRVSGWNVEKAYMLAAQLQSESFKKYLSKYLVEEDIHKDAVIDINNIKDSDYVNINQNKLGSLLNAYYLENYHSVDNSKTNKGMGRLMGFSSSTAKKQAKDHIADKIIDIYQKELNKPRELRKTTREIIDEVRNEINETFIKRADDFANNVLFTDKYNKNAKEYAQKYKDINDKLIEISKEINDENSWMRSLQAQINLMKNKSLTINEKKEYDNLVKDYDERLSNLNRKHKALSQYIRDRRIMALNLIDLYSSNVDGELNVRNRNYANLFIQINANADEFFFEVYHNKKMTNLIKEYDKIGHIEEFIEDEDINNDKQDNQFNNQSIDETTKTWEDSLYKNFNQAISTKMKFMLSRVRKLNSPFNSKDESQSIDTNNELGVESYYDFQYLTVQIKTYGDFSNVESMISSLEKKSKEIKALYGLGEFINTIKQDRNLANFVYANFAKPIVNKVMVTINDVSATDGIVFDYSNPNAFNKVKTAFDMINKIRCTYYSTYDINDVKKLNQLYNVKNENIDSTRTEFQDIVIKYFPNFDTSTFDNIYKLPNKDKVVKNLISNFIKIVNGLGKIKDDINNQYNTKNSEYQTATQQYNKLSSSVNQNIIRFANIIAEYSESKVCLNTANAEGHTASDIIKNCFISRFFDMILAETAEDSNAGLKALGNYLIQGTENGKENQYSNNPLFFGLKDKYGMPIKGAEGMFTKTPTGFDINPNAKNILQYVLFDGVKNNNSGLGTVYSKMSKIDFFVTQYITFKNSLVQRTENGNLTKVGNLETAVYPMRIGADAPKIFMIRAPKYNRQQAELALFNHFLDEMNMFVQGINNLFTNESGRFITKTSVDGLISRAYYNEKTATQIRKDIKNNKHDNNFTEAIVENGRLTGNMFKFNRLFDLDDYSFNNELENVLSLYGQDNADKPALFIPTSDGRLQLNEDYLNSKNNFLILDGNQVKLNLSNSQRDYIMNMVHKWTNAFLSETNTEISEYLQALKNQNIDYNEQSINSFLLNSVIMNINYDDMFEGDFKYYNNERDFFKRTKETQSGGDSYENTSSIDSTNEITNITFNGNPANIKVKQTVNGVASDYITPTYNGTNINQNEVMIARTGWRAVTIYNTIRPADEADKLQKFLEKQFKNEGMNDKQAHERSVKIAKGYWDNTITNDAQSYITLEEFIRRKDAEGTLDEYQDLLAQILDPNVSAEEIDIDAINARIQIQKNFYFDKIYDAETGHFIPRQIKNAEFVLIPKLLPKDSDLIKIYNWMKKNDIGQLNTAETDKAAKKNIFNIFDEETGDLVPDFESKLKNRYIQTYKYKYLYKQQEVPQHMMNEENKLGTQINKKIVDNVSTAPEQVRRWADEYQDAYTVNIREDYMNFLSSMGWTLDENGKLVNINYATTDADGNELNAETIKSNRETLNLTNYLTRARQEAIRLGMDSNFMEYLITDEFGKPIMPNNMNNVKPKIESIGQALFNRAITRQTLPGWHAAQLTGVGYSRKLRFDPETGIMEVYLPRWSNLIPKGKTVEENEAILKQLETEGIDIHLGYRIPTEGKQSISVLKVVGFTNDALGSTIVVPDAWVTQTGSDFDVDSVYGISWELYRKKDKNDQYKVYKIPYEEETTDDRMLYINYVNNILDNKVKRNNLKEEINDAIKSIKDSIKREEQEAKAKRIEFNKIYKEQDDIRKKIYNENLPNWARGIIKDVNKNAKTKSKETGTVIDLTDAYPTIADKLLKYINKHKVSEEIIQIIHNYIDQQTILLDIINSQKGLYTFNKDDYFSEKTNTIKQIIEDNINTWVTDVENEAKKFDIISFEEFKNLPFIERLSREARNNYILDRMIKIMKDASSREEQCSRSQFEGIAGEENSANTIIDNISGAKFKHISPYNPISQLNYFDDAMGGANLKARSVNWDTMVSKSNRVHGYLSDSDAIYAVLDVEGTSAPDSAISYDEADIKTAYQEDVKDYTDNDRIINKPDVTIKPDFTDQNSKVEENVKHFNSRKEMLNAMFNNADGFIGEVSHSPYTKKGDKFVLKQNTEVEKMISAISKRGVPENRKTDLLSKEVLDYLKEEKNSTKYYNIGYSSNSPEIMAVTNRTLYDENYTPKTIAYLRDTNRLNESVIGTQLSQFKNTSTFLVDSKDTIAIDYFKKNGYNYEVYDDGLDTSNGEIIVEGVGDKIHSYELYTGIQLDGSYTKGGDSIFKEVADELGIKTIGYSPQHMNRLTAEQKQEIENAYQQTAKDLGRTILASNTIAGQLVRRDYLQAKAGDSIFAIGNIVYPGQRNSKGYIVKSKGPSVDGGTGYAVQMAINMGKPIHIFVPSERQWYSYDYTKKDFVKEFPPKLTPKFTGIGTRDVSGNEIIKNFIRQIFINTRDGLYKNTNQNNDTFNVSTGKKQLILKANKFGWSNNNKNIVGDYVTTYTSQTTPHHLDAIKRGGIPNVNTYTFDVYKLITCLGLDHEFSVGFMRQPIISRLVNNYNLTNSIYFGSNSNPIDMTIADLATDLGINYISNNNKKTTTVPIDKYTSLGKVIQALKNDINFVNAFNNIFNLDISELSNKDIINLKFPLRKDYIFQRIKTTAANNTNEINKNHPNAYNQAVIDFSMLIMFRQMQSTAYHINNIIQFSSIDKVGAKQSVRETRRIKDSIDEYRNNDIFKVGDKSWADAVFPLDENDNIDVQNSVNKPIAAAYAYATLPSIQVGKQVFITENDDYIYAEDNIQRVIKHRFNENEYKEWCRYGMTYLYNNIGKLLEPLCVDDRGRVLKFINEETDNQPTNNLYWNEERSRIVGYGVVSESNFTVKDINNPTDYELAEYIKLTPAQKVLFIQRNFPDNQGIFNYIKVTLLNNTDIKNKGISRQYLMYDDQVDSIEDLIQFFRNSYSNHNPLIKLVAIDLIKYAFIAEGFNFRKGYITKVVPNDTLYTDVNNGGMDIINNIDLNNPDNNGVVHKLKELPFHQVEFNYINLFVRSHSELIKTIRLGNIYYKTNYDGDDVMKPSPAQAFIRATRSDNLVVLDNTSNNPMLQSLIDKLQLDNKVNGYVKIDFPIDNTKRDLRLYLVIGGNPTIIDNKKTYKEYYLVPLNLLEKYETYDVSYNEKFNRFNTLDYYLDKVRQLEKTIESHRTENNYIITANELVKSSKQQIGTYSPSTGKLEQVMQDTMALQNMRNSTDKILLGGVNMFIKPINEILLPRMAQANYHAIYVLNNNYLINQYIPKGKFTVQKILDETGNEIEIDIAHFPKNSNIHKYLKNIIDNNTIIDNERGVDEYSYIIKQLKDTKTPPLTANIYRISPVKKTSQEQEENIRQASTIMIDDNIDEGVNMDSSINNSARREIDIDNTSAAIIKQITYDARRNNNNVATNFIRNIESRGVKKNFRSSLIEHRGHIYSAAARYYQSAANDLINKINKFELLGTEYDMSGEELYNVLANYPEYFPEVAKIILDAVTFGNRIDSIFSLDISTEDKETKDAVESIIRSINIIRTNTKVQTAMNNLINIYFKRYSNNPMITEGLMNIRDQFGDIDTVVKLISDPTEIPNTEVQVILKQVYTMFSRAEMFETKRNVDEWKNRLEEIDNMLESLEMNKVIDFDKFQLRQDYNEDYIKERNRIINEYNEAKNNRFNSIDDYEIYLHKQFERDNFMYEHTEQPIIESYYKEDLENRRIALIKGGKSYVEYRMLSAQLYEMNNAIDETDEETSNRITNIKARMNNLKKLTNSIGEEKPFHLMNESIAINNFLNKRREINEKYFNSQEYDGFRETYQRYNSFIKSYDKKHSEETLDVKLNDPEYKEAYDWIKNNGYIGFTKEASDKIAEAFSILVDRTSSISNKVKLRLKNIEGAIDENGTINPLVLTDEQIKLLKKEEETELSTKYDNGDGEIILIKDIPSNIPIKFTTKKVKHKYNKDKMHIIGEINKIISKAINHDTGKLDIPTLFNNDYVTNEERDKLILLYNQLYKIENNNNHINDDYVLNYNYDAYNKALNYYNTNLKNTKQGVQFLRIFTFIDEAGRSYPNKFIYGYKVYNHIDEIRTEAFNFIQNNIEFVPTEYYYQALNKAISENRYQEWFENNHIYNPFSHKYEPIRIWTRMTAKPNSELSKHVEYIPSFDNMERTVKKEYINNAENRKRLGLSGEGYKEFGSNYKRGDSRFDSPIKRNAKEQAMYDLIQQTLNKYATTYQGKRFVGQGYLPRERQTEINGKWALGQVASLFGVSWYSGSDSDSFHEMVDYSHDRDADMPMLQLLKDKGSKQYKKLPNRADFKTDADYNKKLEEVREENRKIAEENRKIDNKIVNKDFRKVMEDFVYNATIFNSRQAAKPYLYLLIEDLAVNNAYMIKGLWDKRLVKDYDISTKDDIQYRKIQQNNTRELIHNLARRLLFSQYHEKSKLRSIANLMQNITSAKYMVFNLYGGISNINTGKVNIAMEEFANEYFGIKDILNAERKYLSKSLSFIASAFTDKSPNLIVALCKEFKVIDFDQVLQFAAGAENMDATIRKVRNFMYSFQSSGEHFMQNTVLLAMLQSNRLYTDSKGKIRIGDFKDFTFDIEDQAMRDVLSHYEELLTNYELYRRSVGEYNIETRLEISTGRKNLNRNFLYSLRDNNDPNINTLYEKIAKAYYEKRNELMKKAKIEFNLNPTVESLYEYKNGKAVLKQEAYEKIKGNVRDPQLYLETLIAEFKEKVKAVNKKIHGVYDKDGAALLETKWYGSLLMQYRKHLFTGIFKRWRRRGYYSEFRGSMERGTYQTLIDFMGTEFTNFKERVKNKQKNGTKIALASIQTTIESALNTIINVRFNWNNLANWEKSNIRRNLAEIGGVLSACLVVMALYGLSDDDDINDDRFKASLLYLADRLYSETTMYGPQGLISEIKTNWNSPLASLAGVNDLVKAISLITQSLFDPDYNPEYQTGRYAGMNKFEVLLKRNTVGLRNLDRVLTIDKNNSYYKIEKSQIGINAAKSFGEILAGK